MPMVLKKGPKLKYIYFVKYCNKSSIIHFVLYIDLKRSFLSYKTKKKKLDSNGLIFVVLKKLKISAIARMFLYQFIKNPV